MEQSNARYLKTLTLKSRPVSAHTLAWSCDAELAVATDDTIYIFFPEYPKRGKEGEADESGHQQFTLSFRAAGVIRPDPAINTQLCSFAGVKLPAPKIGDEAKFEGVGSGYVTGSGGSVGQAVAMQWSPNGLGCNLRPILAILLTNGCLVIFGEHIETRSTMNSSLRARNFGSWKMLWGLGARLPLPDKSRKSGYRNMNERIKSFSWAKEVSPGKALLAYMNESSEVVIMSVQLGPSSHSQPDLDQDPIWQVQEVGRFDGNGPHTEEDTLDPDFVTHGSAVALKWSPWLVSDHGRIATLAYVAKNYVGFRRIVVSGEWETGHRPNIEIQESDTTSICLFLSTDAFVQWEDAIWNDDGVATGRGIIATPFVVKPFEVALEGELRPPRSNHSVRECSSMYANADDITTNPITSLVIHRPDPSDKPEAPLYSFVRLSATSTNRDWYQTNVPEESSPLPQWAEEIGRQTARLVPRVIALAGVDSDSDSEPEPDPVPEGFEDEYRMVVDLKSLLQVHPFRYRIWALESSPGDGCTVLLASKYSTQHQERAGAVRLMFGWPVPSDGTVTPLKKSNRDLTTEGRLWEWMYGQGEEVPGLTQRGTRFTDQDAPLLTLFKSVVSKQRCEFCNTNLQSTGDEATCEHGHSFATCATTGLAIMRPGISRICAVCGLRCLKVSEQARIAKEHLGPEAVVESSGEVCGGCGGKFVA